MKAYRLNSAPIELGAMQGFEIGTLNNARVLYNRLTDGCVSKN